MALTTFLGSPAMSCFDRLVEPVADDIRVRRAESQAEVLRGFAETRYAAKSWDQEWCVVTRIEASASHKGDMLRRGIDIRYIVTSLTVHDPKHLYETVYCARGQAENLIKQHKAQLASDRTSCRSLFANQMRLILHTSAYWLLLDVRDAIPNWHPLRHTEFATIRLRLEDRRTHHRNRKPHSHRARLMLPRGRGIQPRRARAETVRTVKQRGAAAPRALIRQPPTRPTVSSIQ